MSTVWENSHVDRLETLSSPKAKVENAVEDIREAIQPLIGPDAAKILAALAADVATGIRIRPRNDRADTRAACAALERAIELLEAIDPNLDG